MAEVIDRLRAYRTRLLAKGRQIEARAVARCIELVKKDVTTKDRATGPGVGAP